MLQISRKTFIFDERNTQFIEITLKINCCHTPTLGLKELTKLQNTETLLKSRKLLQNNPNSKKLARLKAKSSKKTLIFLFSFPYQSILIYLFFQQPVLTKLE